MQEQSLAGGVPVPNMVYHGYAGLNNNHQTHNVWRASATYVTGAHSMKAGYQGAYEVTDIFGDFASHGLQYRFLAGVPNQITQRITPWRQANRTRWDAFYVQDQWTRDRLTLQGALRYEKAWSFFPAELNGLRGDSRYGGPKRTLDRADGVTGYNDIAPRMGLAYDVFGNGKTAIKTNLSKYWQYAANDGVYIGTNLASTFAQTANRAWTDTNRNFVPDGCDLNVAAASGECGGLDNSLFFGFRDTGSVRSTASVVSPDLLSGWGVRPYDWQFSASVQQQVLPRMSVEFGYSRRSWGNFTVTDNRAIGPADFDQYRFTVPTHPDLPTSGQQLNYLMLKPAAFGRVDNYLTLADDYAPQTAYWHGLEMTVNARMNNGLTLQGGFTTGGGVRDLCELAAQLPELYIQAVGSVLNTLGSQKDTGVPRRGALALGVAGIGELRRAEGGRPGQHHLSVDGQHHGHQRPGLERPLDERQLFRAGGQHRRAARAPGRGQRTRADARSGAPRLRLPGSPHHGGHAGGEDRPLRPLPRQRGLRPLQPAQRQHRHCVQPELRDQRRHLAAADQHSQPALRTV